MKTAIILFACFAGVLSTPAVSQDDQTADAARRALPALIHEEIHDKLGQYSLRYVTAEGTVVMESGELVPSPDGTGLVLASKGEVIYIGDDGKTYTTKYTAGVDGYKVEGDHLPKPVEVPASGTPAVPVIAVIPSVQNA